MSVGICLSGKIRSLGIRNSTKSLAYTAHPTEKLSPRCLRCRGRNSGGIPPPAAPPTGATTTRVTAGWLAELYGMFVTSTLTHASGGPRAVTPAAFSTVGSRHFKPKFLVSEKRACWYGTRGGGRTLRVFLCYRCMRMPQERPQPLLPPCGYVTRSFNWRLSSFLWKSHI